MGMTQARLFNLSVAGVLSAAFYLSVLLIIFSEPVQNVEAVATLFMCLLISGTLLFHSALQNGVYAPTIFLLLFFTWFYIVPGIFQAAANRYFWPHAVYNSEVAFAAAFIVLLFLTFFAIGQCAVPVKLRTRFLTKITKSERLNRRRVILCLVISSLFASFTIIFTFGVENFIGSRGFVSQALSADLTKSATGLLIWFPRTLLLVCLLLVLYLRQRERRSGGSRFLSTILLGAAIVAFMIVAFPGALPRFQFFAIVITLILVLYPFRWPQSRLAAVLVLSFGVFTVFPIAQAINRGMDFRTDIKIPNASEYMLFGDFDGFQTTMNVVLYTELNGHTYGHQMLTAAMFFVPRSFWKGKAEATAELVSADLGWHFTNLSTPIVGELYIDWSYFGVIFGGFLIGYLFRRFDLLYTAAIDHGGITIPRIGIAVFCSIIIILMRGSLLGVIGFCIAPIAIVYAIYIWPYFVRFFLGRSRKVFSQGQLSRAQ